MRIRSVTTFDNLVSLPHTQNVEAGIAIAASMCGVGI